MGDPERADGLRALPGRLQRLGATTREGKVKRILSRNHPEVDRGWLCDKGRFAFPALRARDRIVDPLRACAAAASRSRGTRRSTTPSGCCARRRENVVIALSGSETIEIAYALAKLRGGLGAHSAVLPERSTRARRVRLPLSAIATPSSSSSRRRARGGARADRRPLGQGRAPRRGDRRSGPRGSARPGRRAARARGADGELGGLRATAVLVWSGGGRRPRGGEAALGFDAVAPARSTSRPRRTAAASPTPGRRGRRDEEPGADRRS